MKFTSASQKPAPANTYGAILDRRRFVSPHLNGSVREWYDIFPTKASDRAAANEGRWCLDDDANSRLLFCSPRE
jgi:hypothetical protein